MSEPDTAVCWIHNVPETYTPGVSFKACGECFHVWQTEAEFRTDLAEWHKPEVAAIEDLSKVYSCPLCIHDF